LRIFALLLLLLLLLLLDSLSIPHIFASRFFSFPFSVFQIRLLSFATLRRR